MFWILAWCVAATCSPVTVVSGVFGTGLNSMLLHAVQYETEQACVAEANRLLDKAPQMLFMCHQGIGGQYQWSATGGGVEIAGIKTTYIGPRTLSY